MRKISFGFLVGVLSGYALGSSGVFFILRALGKLPPAWSVVEIGFIMGAIALVGVGLGAILNLQAPPAPVSLVQPGFFKAWRRGLHRFGLALGTVVNTLLLATVYFIAVGITALVARLLGKHWLDTTLKPGAPTYWHSLPLGTKPRQAYYRQF